MSFHDITECPYMQWFGGIKIASEPVMPERAWGAYLPGDEPHWQCKKTGDPCDEDTCPMEVYTECWCPDCFMGGYIKRMTVQELTGEYRCPECGWYGDEHDRISTWDAIRHRLQTEGEAEYV